MFETPVKLLPLRTLCLGAYLLLAACGGGSTRDSAPASAPAVPTGLNATPGNAQVSLVWVADPAANNYQVKRATVSGGPFALIVTSESPSYTDTGLTNGTEYFYTVSAANVAGGSPDSAQVAATPDPAIVTPAAPVNLTANGGNAQVTLTWSSSSMATAYHVKRATIAGGPYTQLAAPGGTSYTDAAVSNGTTYYYVVTALNTAGESNDSAPAHAMPLASVQTPAAPTGLKAAGGNAQIALTWSPSSGAESYHVKRGTVSGGPYSQISAPSGTSFTDPALSNGVPYYYVITAVNTAGESANSAQASATPAAPVQTPSTPIGLTATAGSAQIALSWSNSSGATSYHVKRATVSNGPYTQIAVPVGTSYSDMAVNNNTAYYYVVSALNAAGESANSAQAAATPTAAPVADVTVTVTPTSTHAISKWIYGSNSTYAHNPLTNPVPPQLTLDRAGGNNWTAYNWENNYSNAGSDYQYDNYLYLSSSSTPAANAVIAQITADQAAGQATMITFQLQGLVAADANGDVSTANAPQLSRFKAVVNAKSSVTSAPFTATPPTTDANVYMDEYAWAVDHAFAGQGIFSNSPATYPVFAQLDNEPDIWNSTHLEVQGATEITPAAFITKSINLATALKRQFPEMTVFGAVNFGFSGFLSWQEAISDAAPSNNKWFFDQYCIALAAASATFGKPLVDVYDFHWYSSVTDAAGANITSLNGASLTDAQVQAIVQSPRSLWDPSFTENSWITKDTGSGPIALLPRLKAKIAAENPGMKLSITEYNSGGGNHIAGTLAQADNLGIFGVQGLFAAAFWQLIPGAAGQPYILAGFRAFRDFDGAGSNFGDVSVSANSSNVANVAAYLSTDSSRTGRVVMVLINRSTAAQITEVSGMLLSGVAHLWQMTATSAKTQNPIAPMNIGTQTVSGSSLTLSLPALSVTTVDVY